MFNNNGIKADVGYYNFTKVDDSLVLNLITEGSSKELCIGKSFYILKIDK
jgi:hypothetical protein